MGESLLMGTKELAISSGSACTCASLELSYVLRALGLSDDMAHTSLRFGIGRFTTEEEIDYAIGETVQVVEKLREPPLCGRWSRRASIYRRSSGASTKDQ